MAYRYPVEYFESGDVVTPRDWLLNIREFTDEFNGALDRDNLPLSGVDETRLEANACTKIEVTRNAGTVTLDAYSMAWQPCFDLTIDVDDDPSVLEVEASVWWVWPAVTSTWLGSCCRFRVLVNGVSIAETDWLNRAHMKSSTYLPGVVVVGGGRQLIELQVQVAVPDLTILTYELHTQASGEVPDIRTGTLTAIVRRR